MSDEPIPALPATSSFLAAAPGHPSPSELLRPRTTPVDLAEWAALGMVIGAAAGCLGLALVSWQDARHQPPAIAEYSEQPQSTRTPPGSNSERTDLAATGHRWKPR